MRLPNKIRDQLYIGLTGRMASGKGEVAKYFKDQSFSYISLSDMVREEVKKRSSTKNDQDTINRKNMQDIGNELRKKGGPAILAEWVISKILLSEKKKWIIDGIRNASEVIELKKLGHFYLIGIESDLHVLLKRINSRKRKTDMTSNSELKKIINREWGIGESESGQQVGKCMKMADFTIENNGPLEELKKNCQKILNIIEGENVR